MLRRLDLRNYVIVDRLELEFAGGFGALTGETGAGKSILVDALALALGERAEGGVVRAGCDKAELAAVFDVAGRPAVRDWLAANDFDADEELLLRRVIDSGGRSRAYINGAPATAQQLREVAEDLVDIHGQHAHQSLLRADAQRTLLDAHAGQAALAAETAAAFRAWREAELALATAAASGEGLAREREQLEWQVAELDGLGLGPDEWEALEAEHRRLAHAASLLEGAQFALAALCEGEGACEGQLDAVHRRLDDLATYDAGLGDIAGLLQSAQAELVEAVSLLRRYADRVDLDPRRLAQVEGRIEAIHGAARKFRVRPEELGELLVQARGRLGEIGAAFNTEALRSRVEACRGAYLALAQRLSAGRRQAADDLATAVTALMADLALASGRFEVALLSGEPAAYGLEQVEFRIAGLAGSDARPLARVASGGELSRISLAIQVVASRSSRVPTLIFDEVDVGIGGGVAEIIGRLLRQLGEERQILCVTHLPQVAARAQWQWQVRKDVREGVVRSAIAPLDGEGRVGEIARMLGGVNITDITRRHARELLGI
ncbi:MAG: DNA repair protein RecN [Azonexus sp.]|jgi:DNA repair protein RecN (Recombination protein N)|nr:DNA repair protein RecN [Betaproteobacteria bacterium]MBK8917406.1 DNA repair protein RecN [Betaproteobacteria bacterium]MBP6035956.1 DNA repair protein RecN [Azonexus sp.]MBP6906478.1 DNA repair protein RecN [Azonexus sp.]